MRLNQKLADKYQKIQKIGEGAYGNVYLAKNLQTKAKVAIKTVKIENQDDGIPSTTLRQICILKNINHPNIVKQILLKDCRLLDVQLQHSFSINEATKISLIFQYIEQDLHKYLKRVKQIPIKDAKNYFYQILLGLDYLHSQKIFHRDLKPGNILISSSKIIKIADFGLGRIIHYPLRTMSKQIETLWYRAPELVFGLQKYDLSVDVWSLGCVFYQLIQGSGALFQCQCQVQLIIKIFQYHGTPHRYQWQQLYSYPQFKTTFPKFEKQKYQFKNLSKLGVDLLNKLIAINPKNRITVKQALNHPYFKEEN